MINGLVALVMIVHWVVFVALTVIAITTGELAYFLAWIGAAIETALVVWFGFWFLERFVKFG